jgi:hypothetical protein
MSGSLWSYAIPAAIGLGTAYLGSQSAKKAASTASEASERAAETTSAASERAAELAAAASNRAIDAQLQMFQQGREDLAPFRASGLRGLAGVEANIGPSFQESPGYQFAVGEGINAIDRGASARGMLNSGARLRELSRYGTGMANQEYGNYQNRLAALAGLGQTATGQGVAAGQNAASGIGNAAMQGGAAQGNAYMQGGTAAGNAILQGGQAAAQGITGGTNAMFGGLNAGLGMYSAFNQPDWGNLLRRTP